jgi:hypothetical protein
MKTHTFKGLDGKRRKFEVTHDFVYGWTSHPDEPGHETNVTPPGTYKVSERQALDTHIHEGIHSVVGKKLTEAQVDHLGSQLARWLWRLGYRRPEDDG